MGIEYDGHAFAGWQTQHQQRTVQSCLEHAVSRVAAHLVPVVCAGRTDAGVHALEQVVHFDPPLFREQRSWLMGVNANLPDDVRALWVRPVDASFHARTSAIARFYRYAILDRPVRSALLRHQLTWSYRPMDVPAMQAGADHLIGDHDFTSFRAQGCQSRSPRRMLHFIRVTRVGSQIEIDISANAFLHHMVRNIAGVLMAIGSGQREPDWAREVLIARDRNQGGVTAPPDGLYLAGVYYPAVFGIPRHPVFELLPPGVDRYRPGEN
ncbi:tRNA pseudouridine(38-40) synthase TruA [Candidatus Methylospira mobilis]|uniref:tRNA pseudouridine synthase A n=1 Tax=Candidatus Methylospira mobilis TaxID=1808979 RepID=A0A5Q0BNC9_9GAMM|nr:tRNA pseudouridine(38-40) synthase TruA [Candidatus Methylospira mobilis]QFY45099.1 tRNA pseudouridine(38-40) synthase TruA [Candidatus Methylospira mobilis]WNV06847.1 tRNA pseudouridine(38-40) synthase TruA [Candidatus Methylospira mobilis]